MNPAEYCRTKSSRLRLGPFPPQYPENGQPALTLAQMDLLLSRSETTIDDGKTPALLWVIRTQRETSQGLENLEGLEQAGL